MDVKPAADFLLKKHGRKTVSISTLVAIGAVVLQTGWVDDQMPATRSYVNAQITQATKGLPYLVRSSVEKDVDSLYYLVVCMRRQGQQGVLDRMVIQFKELTGEAYREKTCEELEAKQLASVR